MIRPLIQIISGIIGVATVVIILLSMGIVQPAQIPAQLGITRDILTFFADLLAWIMGWLVSLLPPDLETQARLVTAQVAERFIAVPVAILVLLGGVFLWKFTRSAKS